MGFDDEVSNTGCFFSFVCFDCSNDLENEDEDDDDDDEDEDEDDDDGGVKLRLEAAAAAFDTFVSATKAVLETGVGFTFSKKLKSFKSGNNI